MLDTSIHRAPYLALTALINALVKKGLITSEDYTTELETIIKRLENNPVEGGENIIAILQGLSDGLVPPPSHQE